MKKKTLQKISRLFASLVLVGAMSLGTVAPVNAAGNPKIWDEKDTPTAAFTVEYKRATGVEIPKTDFTVTFTKAGFKQTDDGVLASTDADKQKMPTINEKTVSFTKADSAVKKECADFLGEFLTALNTPANTKGAGIYLYNVTQKTPSVTDKNNSQDELKASADKYLVKVYVAQKSNGSGLYIKGLVVNKGTAENAGNDKVDATPGGPDGGSGTSDMVFTNEYIAKNGSDGGDNTKPEPNKPETYGLKVEKVVDGSKADSNKEFNFSMTITKPADLSLKDTQYTFYKVSADGAVGDAVKGNYDSVETFTLKASESILVKSCYAGSALKIEEKGTANWTPQVKVVLNGNDLGTTNGTMGTNLTYTSDDTNKIGQKTNTVKYTNTFLDNPVTGIIVNNFPFVMMIVMAMAAFVAIVAVKSRRRMNER